MAQHRAEPRRALDRFRGSPKRPLEYYFGAVGGGLWKTTDGGTTWNPVTDGQIHSSSVGAVAVSESNPDVVYIGMGESCIRGNIMQGDGVYKSTDAGKTWKHIGLADTQAISRIRIHPTNPDIVYVAAFGHPSAPNAERGVFRSKDGGKTWTKILFRNDQTGAVDLAMDPNNPNVLYAAIWEAYRTPWQLSSGGPGSGLFKSTDGGDTGPRSRATRVCPQASSATSASPSPAPMQIASTPSSKTRTAACSFRRRRRDVEAQVNEDRNAAPARLLLHAHLRRPEGQGHVYVLNTGFYKSTDGGKTYRTIRPPHGDNHDLWIDPNDPQRMIEANDGGGNVSVNGGATWTAAGLSRPRSSITWRRRSDFPYHVCGAQQDNSTICVPSSVANARGATIAELAPMHVGGGESGYIAPHPTNPNIFYAGSQGALLTRFDRRTG